MRRIAALATIVLVLAACGGGVLDTPLEGRVPYVVDGDGAIDDLKAILYLLGRPEVSLRAVTMSGTGVGHCPQGAKNAKAMLERVGAPDIPVACGRTTPLEGANTAPTEWRKAADSLGGMALAEPGALSDLTAPELLARTIAASPEPVVLVALGPLTNLAEAIEDDPSFQDNLEMIYVMGGAVDVGGNVYFANQAAEFNIWADPHAAAIVFSSGAPITLVPLDATNAVPTTPRQWEVLAAHHATPEAAFLHDYLSVNPLYGGLYHWDDLTAVIATDETVATFEQRTIAVVEEGGQAAGATVESPGGSPVRVAVDADRTGFERLFYTAITGEDVSDVPAWMADAVVAFDGTECRYAGPDPLPERLTLQIDNASPEMVSVVLGRYQPGTTRADIDAYVASGQDGVPSWWVPVSRYFAGAGGHEVWVVQGGGPDVAAICADEDGGMFELAGPRP